jgi:predicted  nucleic acid-binding Zn-ribbon protein
MSEAVQLIENLTTKIERLLALLQAERASVSALTAEKEGLEAALEQHQEKLMGLEEDVRRLKMANGLLSGNESGKEARAGINEILREIDRCIALLNE